MASMHIETQCLGDFKYRNWIIYNDDGEIVAYDQDAKFCARVLGLEPSEFMVEYMDSPTANTMKEMEALILTGIERRLEELDMTVNNLLLYT